jgi:DNA-binding CsgD family transcriptional regulator
VALAGFTWLLQFIEYKLNVLVLPTEIYIAIIALLFTGLGIWAGRRLVHQKSPEDFVPNRKALDYLGISKRELEVLVQLAAGNWNKDIAENIFVSPNTVKTHLSHLYDKLGVTRRTQAVMKARELRLIFFGVKRYRDRELGGVIRYSTASQVGLGITLVAALIYVVAWEVNLSLTDCAFINDYTDSIIEQRRMEGATEVEMSKLVAEMEAMKESYGNTIYRLTITFMEIFPIGVVITLISAAILRKNQVLPTAEA